MYGNFSIADADADAVADADADADRVWTGLREEQEKDKKFTNIREKEKTENFPRKCWIFSQIFSLIFQIFNNFNAYFWKITPNFRAEAPL